jgi:hypothetical protein
MEGNVWQLFVQVASSLSSLFASLSNPAKQNNGIASPNAPATDAPLISTLTSVTGPAQNLLRITRNPTLETADGLFGDMAFNGQWLAKTIENKRKAIPEGLYTAKKDISPRLGYLCPHLQVPERDAEAGGDAGIRIHVLNYPCQSEGCIGPGELIDGDSIDHSQAAFDRMMAAVPDSFTVEISSTPQ